MIDRIHQNKSLIEQFSELLDTTFAKFKMDLVFYADPLPPQESNEFQHDWSETENDEREQENYNSNSGRDQCHNSNNLPVKVRTTVLNDQDLMSLKFKQIILLFCLWLFAWLAKSLIKFKSIKPNRQ